LAEDQLNAMVVCSDRHEALSLGRALRKTLPSLNVAICTSSQECLSLLETEAGRYGLLVAEADAEGCDEIKRWTAQNAAGSLPVVYLSSPGSVAEAAGHWVQRSHDNGHLEELSRLALELLSGAAVAKPGA
jgi:hypothetical protein